MKRVLMFTSLKGGVGKTTAASAIAFALAFFGKRVLCVDLDFGVRGLDLALGAENNCSADALEVITEGYDPASEAVEVQENLWFLPAPALFNTREVSEVTATQISRFLSRCRASYDFTILDLPAGGGELFLPLAKNREMDSAVVVTTAESAALRAAEQTGFELRAAGVQDISLIINRLDVSARRSNKSLFDMAKDAAIGVVGVVPEDALVSNAYDAGVALTRLPVSDASQAYWNIAARLTGVRVPLFEGILKGKKRRRYSK
ncbi:MAG: P-loop NTPase [Clostridia bacterium]|nr:P-loop NTPase [Clostridia bacterium]